MYDYKALKKIIYTLGVAFVVVLAILLLTSRPLGGFALISALFMVAIAAYFILIPLRLLREMKEMENLIEGYKKAARNNKEQPTPTNEQTK